MVPWTREYKEIEVTYLGSNQYLFTKGGEILPTRQNTRGYFEVRYKKWTPFHRIIYHAYHSGYKRGYSIHHISHTKTDNRVENLIAISSGLHKEVHRLANMRGLIVERPEIEELKMKWDCYEELRAYKTYAIQLELEIQELKSDLESVKEG